MSGRDAALAVLRRRLQHVVDVQNAVELLTAQALQEAADVVRAADPGEDVQAAYLLGIFHWYRYRALPAGRGQEEFEVAVRLLLLVYQVDPRGVPEPFRSRFDKAAMENGSRDVALVTRRAKDLFERYQRTGQVPLLSQAVELLRGALQTVPEDHPDRSTLLSNLGAALLALFGRSGDVTVLAEAVDIGREGVAATPEDHPDRAGHLSSLGVALFALFGRSGDVEVLAQAVDVGYQAVAATPEDHFDRAGHLTNLGTTLLGWFERSGVVAVLAEAVDVGRRAVAATPENHPDPAGLLTNLGSVLLAWFRQSGDAAALTEAVDVGRQAVAAAPEDHPNRVMYLTNLGGALGKLFERFGDAAVLAEAVEVGRQAVAATPGDHPDHAVLLSNLGTTLRMLFKRSGDVAVLAEAVDVGRRALAATPESRLDRTGRMNNLGSALFTWFEQSGDAAVLAEAVDVWRQAVAATPEDHPDRAMFLTNLGNGLGTLFEWFGDAAVLAEAVDVGRQAVAAIPEGHPDRAMYLTNLGIALRMLFERSGDVAVLAEAVVVGRQAVAATPGNHPGRAGHLSSLGIVLRVLFERSGVATVLAEAVDVGRRAVAATPDDHPDRAGYLNDLGIALRMLFERSGDVAVLVESIDVGRRAVAARPDDHPDRVACTNNLGTALQRLFERSGDATALAEAIDGYRSSSRNTAAAAILRVEALRQWAVLAEAGPGAEGEALAAVESAVALLPQISPRTLARGDREYQLGRLGSLADVAAAAALTAGSPQRAVELLEATRGMLAADAIDTRGSDVARLRALDSELAQRFEDLRDRRDALDRPADRTDLPATVADGGIDSAYDDRARARALAQTEWDGLISSIRAMDGFSTFLAAPPISELTAQARHGRIVFLTAGPTRCDALIITGDAADPVLTVALNHLRQRDAYTRANQLRRAYRAAATRDLDADENTRSQQEVLEILAWLWDTVAEPVLNALGHADSPAEGEDWPRIWWCPVGVMGYLPLHAAGHHCDLHEFDPMRRAAPRTVLDRVVSSYTPTVRALAYARSHPPTAANATLVVAVPDAPGTSRLPGVEAEADAIKALIPEALRPDRPTRAEVLAALPTHPVAHFSCHGLANWNDPATSRLILHDHQTNPLTVADISALHLTGALAYLSACSTSSTSPRLADEAVHLTAAFHLAGYQNVIGTLWPVNDRTATHIAAGFYARLTANGTRPPDTAIAARALHDAVRVLRGQHLTTPTYWAAHVHTGV